ncbi:hypothetical protein [Cellulophaga omnivescoria]|uniref:hypothetical protein n=1 Tax=Cellulophaga omnivescoria TaxID=1888890 RepID=UPI0022F0DA54|nr:hypothetical protein [Cellulophaga omnivescoria]WBU87910.1 hypothetical protein PBN93_08490 [Cellulophaga omnivescoria]
MKLDINYYQNCFNNSKKKFSSLTGLHPAIEKFKLLIPQININQNVAKLTEEIERNILEYWTNQKFRKSDLETKLDALLFEYGHLDEIDSKVYAYGIIDYNPDVLSFPEIINLDNYDLCSDFQAHPGLTLSITNDLHNIHWQKLEDEYPNLEIYFEKGWNELMEVYKNAIYLCLSKAFKKIIYKGTLDKINMNSDFYIFIQEHDCGARLIAKNNIA